MTPTVPPSSSTGPPAASNSPGAFRTVKQAVGFGIGFGLAMVLLAAAVLWWSCRRRRRNAIAVSSYTAGEETPQRRPSRLSQMGLLGGNSRPMSERVHGIDTSGWGPAGGTNRSPDEITHAERRFSYPLNSDSRLEPSVLWQRSQWNESHVSLGDDKDYTRRLHVSLPHAIFLVTSHSNFSLVPWHVSMD